MNVQKINKYRKELMGIAALWIFYYHAGELLFADSGFTLLKNVEWYVKGLGYCGVEIFLFLSGIGLVYAIHKQDLKTFYKRRLVRVYPAFLVWFTLSSMIRSDKLSWMEYIGRITFYSNWMEDLLAYKWYIAAIVMLYLWFPLYYGILRKREKPIAFTAIVIACEVLLTGVFHLWIREDLFLFLDRIPVFAVGVLLGHLCVEKPESRILNWQWSRRWKWLLFAGMAVVYSYSFFLHRGDIGVAEAIIKNLLTLVIAIFTCSFFSTIFERMEKNISVIKVKMGLGYIGAFSLEFYLTHELISLKVKSYGLALCDIPMVNQMIDMGVCFCVSFIAAWVLAKTVEFGLKMIEKNYVKVREKSLVALDKITQISYSIKE